MCLVFFIVFSAYFLTAPKTVALEDDGLFILSSYFLGIAQPPGYPLHTLLGKLFTLLPIGSIAFRVHLLSAFFGAATCSVLWWCVRMLVPKRIPAYTGALSLGFSAVFWSQAIIAEVYTLNTFFFFLLFALSLHQTAASAITNQNTKSRTVMRTTPDDRASDHKGRGLVWIAFLYGLSLSNHWPIIVLSTPALLILLWPRRVAILKNLYKLVLAVLLGLLPYAWMVLRSQADPLISFYGPITSWQDLWFYVSRQGYSGVDISSTADWTDKLQYVAFLIREMIAQFTIVGAFVAALGFIRQWRYWPARLALSLFLAHLFTSFVLLAFLNFDYDYLFRAVFRVYPLVAYGVMSVWLALGISTLSSWILVRWDVRNQAKSVLPAASLVVIIAIVSMNAWPNYRHNYSWSKEYAVTSLQSLPPDTAFFVHGDVELGTIGYFHLVEGVRPDVVLYNQLGLVFKNRLFPPVESDAHSREQIIRAFITRTERPVYFVRNLRHDYRTVYSWLYKRVDKRESGGPIRVHFDDELINFFERIGSQDQHTDPWTIFHRQRLIIRFASMLGLASASDRTKIDQKFEQYLNLVNRSFYGALGVADGMLANPQAHSVEKIWKQLHTASKMIDASVPKIQQALYYELLGILKLAVGDREGAVAALHDSISTWPHPANTALARLMRTYQAMGSKEEYMRLKRRFFGREDLPAEVEALDKQWQ